MAQTDTKLLYVGPWNQDDPAGRPGGWIGAYVRIQVTGTSDGIDLGGNSDLDVILDNAAIQVVVGGPGRGALNSVPHAPGTYTLRVGVKGGGWNFKGLVLDPYAAVEPPIKRPTIESMATPSPAARPARLKRRASTPG